MKKVHRSNRTLFSFPSPSLCEDHMAKVTRTLALTLGIALLAACNQDATAPDLDPQFGVAEGGASKQAMVTWDLRTPAWSLDEAKSFAIARCDGGTLTVNGHQLGLICA